MLILGLDSSSAACSVAIIRDGDILSRESLSMTRGHAAALPPMISRVLRNADLKARDLDAFAVSIGPGSFTGLRVAMAAAKGLAVATNRPLIGVSCFDAVARRAIDERGDQPFDVLLLTLASKREEIFVQATDSGGVEIISGDVLAPIEIASRINAVLRDNASLYISGDAMEKVVEVVGDPNTERRFQIHLGSACPPDASDVALHAEYLMSRDQARAHSYSAGLTPLYLRPPATKAP